MTDIAITENIFIMLLVTTITTMSRTNGQSDLSSLSQEWYPENRYHSPNVYFIIRMEALTTSYLKS